MSEGLDIFVDFGKLAEFASRIASDGATYATKVNEAYGIIRDMNEVWKGTRYGDLVRAFNGTGDMITVNPLLKFQEMRELLCTKLPKQIDDIGLNYATSDNRADAYNRSSATEAEDITAIDVSALDTTGTLRYNKENVAASRSNLSSKFNEIATLLDNLEKHMDETLESSAWKSSQASTAFIDEFKSLKKNISGTTTEVDPASECNLGRLLALFDNIVSEVEKVFTDNEEKSSATH